MKKRVLSTVAAGAFAATQLVMPVAAATGTVTVPVETQTTVLRVEVPTTLKVAVNEFESRDAGSQIYSAPFTMLNKSAVPVKVDVTSTLDVNTGVKLVASADAIENEGDAWLAVAAKTAADSYGADLAALTNESSNVTTFDATGKKAAQTFYLAGGTGDAVYRILEADADDANAGPAAYGDAFALTEKDSTVFDGNDDDGALAALLAAGSVYTEDANGKVEKVAEGASYDGSKTYYAAAATAATSFTATSKYVYSEQATAGGEAAFRYIGKLSEEKTGGWTKADIKEVAIVYDIQGVGSTVYDGKKVDCVYGLYTAPAAPSIPTAKTVEAKKAIELDVNLGAGSKRASGIASVTYGDLDLGNLNMVSYADGKLTLSAELIDTLIAEDRLPAEITVTFNMADSAAEKVQATVTLNK